jgi:hypothetical protein
MLATPVNKAISAIHIWRSEVEEAVGAKLPFSVVDSINGVGVSAEFLTPLLSDLITFWTLTVSCGWHFFGIVVLLDFAMVVTGTEAAFLTTGENFLVLSEVASLSDMMNFYRNWVRKTAAKIVQHWKIWILNQKI